MLTKTWCQPDIKDLMINSEDVQYALVFVTIGLDKDSLN